LGDTGSNILQRRPKTGVAIKAMRNPVQLVSGSVPFASDLMEIVARWARFLLPSKRKSWQLSGVLHGHKNVAFGTPPDTVSTAAWKRWQMAKRNLGLLPSHRLTVVLAAGAADFPFGLNSSIGTRPNEIPGSFPSPDAHRQRAARNRGEQIDADRTCSCRCAGRRRSAVSQRQQRDPHVSNADFVKR